MSELDVFINQFLAESHENLDKLDRTLVELEKNPTAKDKLASIFRIVHSIKGTTSFFGFSKLGALTHAGENLLSRMRDGVLILNAEITTGLLAMVDAVRQMLSNIEKTGGEGEKDYAELIARLNLLYDSGAPGSPSASDSPSRPPGAGALGVPGEEPKVSASKGPESEVSESMATEGQALKKSASEKSASETSAFGKSALEKGALEKKDEQCRLGELLLEAELAQPHEIAAAVARQQEGDTRRVGEILVADGALDSGDLLDVLNVQQQVRSALAANIRVDVGQLDKLMDLVGELVLARNQILQFSAGEQDVRYLNAIQRLNLITTELQEGIMKARMQPIDTIWSKFPRVVRDLALHFGKRVRLEMEGSETELDRTIIEAIRDPLTHLVRNCVDHGIESPEKRLASGKAPEGHLSLRAFHEGGQVNIEISDDGAGIDPDRLKRKAIDLGLITVDQAYNLDDRGTMNLIFLPGFSTAEKITDVSGRGVGMDVVKTNIEKIGGIVDLESKLKQGTMLKIRIPLTLAIIPALIVASGGQRYAIPQTSLLELVRLESDKSTRGVEWVQEAPVYRLRGNLLPLIYLNHELDSQPASPPLARVQREDAVANIVVLRVGSCQFGLVVDEVSDMREIVVKPLGRQLKKIVTFAGATIMGDGRVALILDVIGLANRARVLAATTERKQRDEAPILQIVERRQSLLLFMTAGGALMAVPLSRVTRLEEFLSSMVERTGGNEVVQYEGDILPLVDLSSLLRPLAAVPIAGEPGKKRGETIQVVVYSEGGRRAGLVIEQILEIVEEDLVISYPPSRKGSMGSAVIQGRVVEILDMDQVLKMEVFLHALQGWRAHTDRRDDLRELAS